MAKKPEHIEPKAKEKEITAFDMKINKLARAQGKKEITEKQIPLDLGIDREHEVDGIGMGVLSDGTPYLSQRGLAALCDVQNAHIGTISSQWGDDQKPRISTIKSILNESGIELSQPHIEVLHKGTTHFCYTVEPSLAIMEYYAFHAGSNLRRDARKNFRLLSGSKLKDLIYDRVGYDQTGSMEKPLRKWHERIELNHQSAPSGYFNIFNEVDTIIYELIKAGANIGEKIVPDISVGQFWAKYWDENNLATRFEDRKKFPHRYPKDHPQARANPQIAHCYPLASLGEFRRWLQEEYIAGGKFKNYLRNNKEIPPSIAQLAIERLSPTLIEKG